jgi:hypothetical protein
MPFPRARRLDDHDGGRKCRHRRSEGFPGRNPTATCEPDVLRTRSANGTRTPSAVTNEAAPASVTTPPTRTFMAGEPMNCATKQVDRLVVQLQGRPDLLDPTVVHDDDLVGHGHGLDLVVGHVDRGRAQAVVQMP